MAPGLGTTPDHKVRLCDPLQARMVSLRERTDTPPSAPCPPRFLLVNQSLACMVILCEQDGASAGLPKVRGCEPIPPAAAPVP